MSDKFEDDLADGDGRKASMEEVTKVRDWLKSRNRSHSINCVLDELVARNFKGSRATIARYLKPADGSVRDQDPVQRAENRNNARKMGNAAGPPHTEAMAKAVHAVEKGVEKTEAVMVTIAELTAIDRTSTALAIMENRERMALNIITMRAMAEKPELLLLDMRGAAALIDALTCAAKLSGGASIDISRSEAEPASGLNGGNGHDMVDVTPKKSALLQQIDNWRGQQRPKKTNGNGQGTSGD
jgi:hypothetical protein